MIGFSSFLTGQSTSVTSEEEKEIKKLVQGIFDDVWGGLDSTKILDYHTEDFIILENGELWENSDIKNYVRNSLNQSIIHKRENSFDFISMEKQGTSIWAAYHNYASFSVAGKETGKGYWLESIVAIPTDQGWRLRMMHSTWVPVKK
jgi:hypothetical protein